MNAYRRGVRLTVTLAPKASAAIDALLATGLYGRSRAAIAQWFIYQRLQDIEGPLRLKAKGPRARR